MVILNDCVGCTIKLNHIDWCFLVEAAYHPFWWSQRWYNMYLYIHTDQPDDPNGYVISYPHFQPIQGLLETSHSLCRAHNLSLRYNSTSWAKYAAQRWCTVDFFGVLGWSEMGSNNPGLVQFFVTSTQIYKNTCPNAPLQCRDSLEFHKWLTNFGAIHLGESSCVVLSYL